MRINGISIVNRLTAGTIRRASYTDVYGVEMVDISVGILPNNSSTLVRRIITVPAQSLLNGATPGNVRTARYSHLMNIISSHAETLWNIDFKHESVIFLGFPQFDGTTTTTRRNRFTTGVTG